MFSIESMTEVYIYMFITLIVLFIYLYPKNPLSPTISSLKTFFTSWKMILHFAAIAFILFLNKIELTIEESMNLKYDLTPLFYGWEGNIVYTIQNFFQNDILTIILVFFYVVVFTSLIIASFLVYLNEKDHKLFYTFCYAIMLNYGIAIPFYLFFPINEVWAHEPAGVSFLMLDVFPTFETEYRALSGLNNCFPSLHTSISVTLSLIALKSSNMKWKRIVLISAAIIIFSIFYLGIHWVIDMIGGVLLAVFAVYAAQRIADRDFKFGKRKTHYYAQNTDANETIQK
ncbi:phosphatase PAP2 family protein [Chengkuizengella axinellae]|uniref:Phosphatase PAP2 family protein n=1 Tax=Chengkuizengella axinellae TaxID=3064388 RepID=A0ABT9ITW0_9BACL|nr:phosphatase PAP2 family protein [Chengkuizengella sp. 2205SS18-9]MDP5272765.1 phosphatase PAP2 family protein [Chengkuizengella sp. 2205SS18-9]